MLRASQVIVITIGVLACFLTALLYTTVPATPISFTKIREKYSSSSVPANQSQSEQPAPALISNSSDKEKSSEPVPANQSQSEPAPTTIPHNRIDAMCTLQHYSHLSGLFCDPIDRFSCDLEAIQTYFDRHKDEQNLEWGCTFLYDDAVCYANRYPHLLQAHCNGDKAKCNYYSLRSHYEKHGKKKRLAWGCELEPIQPPPKVSELFPLVTVDKLHPDVLGKASLEMFQGTWKAVNASLEEQSQSVCPQCTEESDRTCNFTARLSKGYQPVKYVAEGFPDGDELSAVLLRDAMEENGFKVGFVGDSLMFQLFSEFHCLFESQNQDLPYMEYHDVFMLPFTHRVNEHYYIRNLSDGVRKIAFSLDWVDKLKKDNVTHFVYNTGAWWNPMHFRRRGEWCDYNEWKIPSPEEILSIYTESMEQTLMPILTSIVKDHGIIPIWMDVPSGGEIDLTTGSLFDGNDWTFYYNLFPKFNELGRELVTKAGGLVLPIWDLTIQRWEDHIFHDNNFDYDDQLHWCAQYGVRSVPAVWAQLLVQVIYGDISKNSTKAADYNESVVHKKDHSPKRKLAGNYSIVPLSKSHQTSCACSDATGMDHCRTNILCKWDLDSEVCLEIN